MILDETLNLLRTNYNHYFTLRISRVQIGPLLTAVMLSDGRCGVASTEIDPAEIIHRQNRSFGKFTPGNMCGYTASELFSFPDESKIFRSVRLAVLNAISAGIIQEAKYTIVEDQDPVDLLDLTGSKNICMVGAFQGYMTKLGNSAHHLSVLEFKEEAFREEHKKFYVPAGRAGEIVPQADIIIITGLTLVNNTIDQLLSMIPPGKQVVVVGPSASLVPDILFRYNVNIIGGLRITDPEILFRIAAEAGAGFHLFQYCAKKICILRTRD